MLYSGTDPESYITALEAWIVEILYCDLKGSTAFLRILSKEGRGVRLRWPKSKSQSSKAWPTNRNPVTHIALELADKADLKQYKC